MLVKFQKTDKAKMIDIVLSEMSSYYPMVN